MNYDTVIKKALEVAQNARVTALQATSRANTSHIGSCLSVIDVLAVLFTNKFSSDFAVNDEIILSKGHAAAGLYAVLNCFDSLNDAIDTYCENDSTLYGHVNHHSSSHIPLSTGSLGHGLPFGLGIALSNKLNNRQGRVFVVISDGEINEGTTWESALVASHQKLNNLIVIVDRNRIQSLGFTEETLQLEPLAEKWEAFGWITTQINGHDIGEIYRAISLPHEGPLCVIANTIKGKGVSFMENSIEWHYKSPNPNELEFALKEVLGFDK